MKRVKKRFGNTFCFCKRRVIDAYGDLKGES